MFIIVSTAFIVGAFAIVASAASEPIGTWYAHTDAAPKAPAPRKD